MNYNSYKKTATERIQKLTSISNEAKSLFREGKISLKEFNKEFHCEKFAMRVDLSGLCTPSKTGVRFGKLMRVDGNYHYVATKGEYYGHSKVITYKIVYYLPNFTKVNAEYVYDGLQLKGNIEDLYDVDGMRLLWNASSDYGKKKLKALWKMLFYYRAPFVNINDFMNKLEQNS